jgi:hypothetical protein
VIDGKKVISVPEKEVSGYVVRIWGRARAADKLYQVTERGVHQVESMEKVNLIESNHFKIIRRKIK